MGRLGGEGARVFKSQSNFFLKTYRRNPFFPTFSSDEILRKWPFFWQIYYSYVIPQNFSEIFDKNDHFSHFKTAKRGRDPPEQKCPISTIFDKNLEKSGKIWQKYFSGNSDPQKLDKKTRRRNLFFPKTGCFFAKNTRNTSVFFGFLSLFLSKIFWKNTLICL